MQETTVVKTGCKEPQVIALFVSVAISAPAVSHLRPRPVTGGEAMDVDEVTAALAVVAVEEKPAGRWEE